MSPLKQLFHVGFPKSTGRSSSSLFKIGHHHTHPTLPILPAIDWMDAEDWQLALQVWIDTLSARNQCQHKTGRQRDDSGARGQFKNVRLHKMVRTKDLKVHDESMTSMQAYWTRSTSSSPGTDSSNISCFRPHMVRECSITSIPGSKHHLVGLRKENC